MTSKRTRPPRPDLTLQERWHAKLLRQEWAKKTPTYLYRCRDSDGHLLYVGTSEWPVVRMETHRRKPWGPDIVTVDLEEFPNRPAALAAERDAIRTEAPRHNLANRRRA